MAQAPSGQGRFMGTAYRVEKGVEKSELVVLVASNVPASSVGPTDIPLRIAMGSLPKDKVRDGGKLARSLFARCDARAEQQGARLREDVDLGEWPHRHDDRRNRPYGYRRRGTYVPPAGQPRW